MGGGLLVVKNGFIFFIKSYQFPLQINTVERDLLGESISYQMEGESVGWWSNFILSSRKTGGVFRGVRHVTSPSRQSGTDTSSRPLTGTGTRHVTSLSPDRGSTHHVVTAYQGTLPSLGLSVGKFLPSPIQSVPIPSTRFFSFSITVFVTPHALIHIRPGPSGVTGFMGSLLDLMRQTLGS
jgi:hypothetical protein